MSFEIRVPTNSPLSGGITAQVLDHEGVEPGDIINVNDDWAVYFKWFLKGPLAKCIAGKWCLRVHLESIGEGPDFSLFNDAREVHVDLDPCGDGHYHYKFRIPAGTVPAEACSAPYKIVATLSYKNPCGHPGPMAGFAELPMVQFYQSDH